jgi:hypothetical protein
VANTRLLVLPVSVLAQGTRYGPYATAAVGAPYTRWLFTVTPSAWPTSGSDVLIATIEYAPDGINWQGDVIARFGPQPWTDIKGNALSTGTVSANVGPLMASATAVNALYRITLDVNADCAAQCQFYGVP